MKINKLVLFSLFFIVAFFCFFLPVNALDITDLSYVKKVDVNAFFDTTTSNSRVYTFTNSFTVDNYDYVVFPYTLSYYLPWTQSGSTTQDFEYYQYSYTIYIRDGTWTGTWTPCQLQTGYIICPVTRGVTYKDIVIRYNNQQNMTIYGNDFLGFSNTQFLCYTSSENAASVPGTQTNDNLDSTTYVDSSNQNSVISKENQLTSQFNINSNILDFSLLSNGGTVPWDILNIFIYDGPNPNILFTIIVSCLSLGLVALIFRR